MLKDEVALAIVMHNTPEAVARAVSSAALPPEQVIIVSNGSCDEADAEIGETAPGVSFIQVRPQRGLTYAWNIGLRLPAQVVWPTLPTWTVIANDDVVFDADWLAKLAAGIAEHPSALHIGMAYPSSRYSCFAIHRDLVRKIGWFDERFTGIYYEDEDWHLRLSEYSQCPPGTRAQESDPEGIFAIAGCALHDHDLRAADAKRFGRQGGLSRTANRDFFLKKWRRVDEGGWASKGKVDGVYMTLERALPEIEWYPRDLLGGKME